MFDNRHWRTLLRWLELRCPPDPEHPTYMVKSVYYDTLWRSLEEKINSDFIKSKIRLRWYADARSGEPTSNPRLEVKLKRGGRRAKIRLPVDIAAAELARTALHDLRQGDVVNLLRSHGVNCSAMLLPAFQIDYTRSRFTHPPSGACLCLDYDIHVSRVNRAVCRHDPRLLEQAVFEIKGTLTRLPPDLSFLTRLGCRKQSFSKYLACYRRLTGGVRE